MRCYCTKLVHEQTLPFTRIHWYTETRYHTVRRRVDTSDIVVKTVIYGRYPWGKFKLKQNIHTHTHTHTREQHLYKHESTRARVRRKDTRWVKGGARDEFSAGFPGRLRAR